MALPNLRKKRPKPTGGVAPDQSYLPGGKNAGKGRNGSMINKKPKSLGTGLQGSVKGGPPKPPLAPPPESMRTRTIRNRANRDYTTAQINSRNALYQAALQYGDPEIMAQYGQRVALAANPNSEISTINRNRDLQRRQVAESANEGNTFFSGLHGRNQGYVADEAASNLSAAYRKWMDLFDDEQAKLFEALTTRDDLIGDANLQDIDENSEREFSAPLRDDKPEKKKKKKKKGKK